MVALVVVLGDGLVWVCVFVCSIVFLVFSWCCLGLLAQAAGSCGKYYFVSAEAFFLGENNSQRVFCLTSKVIFVDPSF